jgi:O-antigen ligase
MTTLHPSPVADPDHAEAPLSVLRRPLWIVSGQLSVVVAIVIGFGARGDMKPKIVIALLSCCLIGLVAFSPVGRVRRIVLTAPVVAVTTWWILSYLWTFNAFGWWTDTQLVIPYVITCVVAAALLPADALRRALVAACYVAIGLTIVELVLHPAAATVSGGGPGWRGGFIHKNSMGPFMVFAALTIASFDRPSLRRRVGLLVAIGLTVLSQSTTALAAGVVTLLIWMLLHRLAASTRAARASLVIGALAIAAIGWVLSNTLIPAILGMRGKDSTLTGRTDIWNGVVRAIEQRPWQGYGVGGVWHDPSVDPAHSIMNGLGHTAFHSHNGYLEILLLLGVVGLALFVWLLISTVRLGLVNLRRDTPMAVFAVSYVVLIAVLSITEVVVFGIWLGLLCGVHGLMSSARAHRHDTLDPIVR